MTKSILNIIAVILLAAQIMLAMPIGGDHHSRRNHESHTKIPDHLDRGEIIERGRYHWSFFLKHFGKEFYDIRLGLDFTTIKRIGISLPPAMMMQQFHTCKFHGDILIFSFAPCR